MRLAQSLNGKGMVAKAASNKRMQPSAVSKLQIFVLAQMVNSNAPADAGRSVATANSKGE